MDLPHAVALCLRLRRRMARRDSAEAQRAALRLQVAPKGGNHEVVAPRPRRGAGARRHSQVGRSDDGVDGRWRALVAARGRHSQVGL
eukprot:7278394-Alexandrium_andersonii.AAC.1